jgi:hypothetical protein
VKSNILKATTATQLTAVCLGLAAFQVFAQNDTIRFHALVLAERGAQHEAFVVAALQWLKSTGARDNFSIDVFENPNQFNRAFLARYQVVNLVGNII